MAFFLLHSVPLQFSAVKFPLGTGMSSGRSTLLFSTNHDINEIPGCSLSVRHLVWVDGYGIQQCWPATPEVAGTVVCFEISRCKSPPQIPLWPHECPQTEKTHILFANRISGRSLSVRHLVWDQAQAGSTPVARTKSPLKSMISEDFSLFIVTHNLMV